MNTELDLRQIVKILQKNLWMILLSVVLFGAAAYAYSKLMITPTYDATASLYVYNETLRSDAITSSDLATSQKLVQTYIVVLTSDSVLNKVSNQLDGQYKPSELRKMLSASSIDNTEAFRITIRHEDPVAAQTIANNIADVAPAEIIRVVKAGAVEVIDHASLPQEPSAPNVLRNTVVGLLLGLVLSAVIAVLRALFDTVIRTEEDIQAVFQLPILGVIPSIKYGDAGGSYGYNKK